MSSKFFQLKSFFTYWLDAVDEHSLHSPFLFDLYTNILKKDLPHSEFDSLRKIRRRLRQDQRILHVKDLGAGSLLLKTSSRKIADIARISVTPEKFSTLYAAIIRHYNCRSIVELGTSLGLNTLYLAKAEESVKVFTFEGSPEVAHIATHLFQENQLTNIQLIEGNIDDTLSAGLSAIEKIDFALIDANHRFEPTLQYVDLLMEKIHPQSILVVDDIHYSEEMEQAWHTIQAYDRVYTTVDLYRCGLIFFNPSLTRQNVVLQF